MSKPSSVYAAALQSTSVYAIGVILGRAVSILLLPLYTRYLTASDYGILELVDVTMTVFALIVGARVTTAVAYFCAKSEFAHDNSLVYSTNLIGSALAALLAVAFGWFLSAPLGPRILGVPHSDDIFRLGLLGFTLSFPSESYFARLRVENRPVVFISLQFSRLLLAIGLNVLFLVVFHLGFHAILWTNILCNLAFAAYGAWDTFRSGGLRFSLRLFVSMLKFAVPVGAVGLSLFVFHVADRFFLRRYASLSDIGVYSLGYKLGMLISFVATPFSQYWSAQSYQVLKGERGPEVFSRMFTFFFASILFASVATLAFARPALLILTTPGFHAALAFVPWIVLAYLLRLVSEYLRQVLYTSLRPGLDAVVNLSSAAFCLVAYAVLISAFGAMGAAWATAATAAVMFALSAWFGRRVFPMRFEIRSTAVLILAAIAALVLHRFLPASSIPLQVLSGSAACLLFLAAAWFGALGQTDRARIQQAVRDSLTTASSLRPRESFPGRQN